MPSRDPIAMNVKGVTDLVRSGLNKTSGQPGSQEEGITGDQISELDLKLDEAELLDLAAAAEAKYAPYESKIKPRQEQNKVFVLGKQNQGDPSVADSPMAANMLFEAMETFLPAALSKNPEPVVWSDDSAEGENIAKNVKTMLQYHADVLVLRRKLNRMTRQWGVNFLGVLKHGLDPEIGDIKLETRDAKSFVFDPDGTIDEYGDYRGGILGERVKTTAGKLIKMFPKHAAYITVMCDGMMGTPVTYTDWWTDSFTFTTFKNRVLDKSKNPHFNYQKTVKEIDEDGAIVDRVEEPWNHFARPKAPYTFLSVFSMGEHPHDDTGLIEQNIPQQRQISKRTSQIDVNLDRSNNSIGLSGANFNEETGKQATNALREGRPIIIPTGGPVKDAIARFDAQGYPAAVFTQLETTKNDLRSIFGVQGITAQQPDEDQTARGMILNQQYDTTRIGGGIGDALEQVADNVFNWWVQLYCVYYDVDHYAAILGQMKATEYITFSKKDLNRRLVVSVAPNSMKPKDEVTEMNLAQALYDKGVMDPKTLLTILDFPDPQKTAEQAVLWKLDPMLYAELNFPEMFAKLQAKAAATAMVPPGGGGAPPEETNGEPPPPGGTAADPANSGLDQVPIPAL